MTLGPRAGRAAPVILADDAPRGMAGACLRPTIRCAVPVVAPLGMLPMKHKQSSWIGNVALWVALIVTLVVVLILVNRFVPVAAG